MLSQLAPSAVNVAAVHAAPGAPLRLIACGEGGAPPTVVVKIKEPGLTAIPARFSDTETVLDEPPLLTVICTAYKPASREAAATFTVRVAGPAQDCGDTLSQFPPLLVATAADHAAPGPAETRSVCGAGDAPPAVPVKISEEGETPSPPPPAIPEPG